MLAKSWSWLDDEKLEGRLTLACSERVEKMTSGMFHEAGNDRTQTTPVRLDSVHTPGHQCQPQHLCEDQPMLSTADAKVKSLRSIRKMRDVDVRISIIAGDSGVI